MNIAHSPINTIFQPSTAHIDSINIHNQQIKYVEIFSKKDEFAILSQFYTFSNEHSKVEIIRFIKDNYFILEVLIKAPKHITSIFGSNVNLYLELHHDSEENSMSLFITIKTNLSPENALNLLDKLDEEWWLYVEDNISNILEIMVKST